ncbi:MAG: CRISPR-associated protein Cas4 [Elusimicrobiota bacterium]|jgi:CRISPR-associated exonuclease Cas4|nr:CRISPR-associated protein Cas4 [Elusimicrobiota bacterium]
MNKNISITPSEVLEYLFCPRFIYFMKCLDIKQNEEHRIKVQLGRRNHEKRALENKDYRRIKIGCIDKEENVYLKSEKYNVRGEIDEVLFLKDGTLAPLDYKFAEYKNKIFETYNIQIVIYAILIKENYQKDVRKGFICYTRSNSLLKEIEITDKSIEKVKEILRQMVLIIQKGLFPKKTGSKLKCIDCCYKNICV